MTTHKNIFSSSAFLKSTLGHITNSFLPTVSANLPSGTTQPFHNVDLHQCGLPHSLCSSKAFLSTSLSVSNLLSSLFSQLPTEYFWFLLSTIQLTAFSHNGTIIILELFILKESIFPTLFVLSSSGYKKTGQKMF